MTNIFKHLKQLILAVLFVIGSGLLFSTNVLANDNEVILFWGDGCPHCEVVKEEIKEKGYDQIITIEYKEIYNDKDNAKIFDEKIKECGISLDSAGVPMVYASGSCWMGQNEAIYAIEKEIEKNTNSVTSNTENETPTETAESEATESSGNTIPKIEKWDQEETEEAVPNKGKRNTEVMLALILVSLVVLVATGYSIQNKKSKVLNTVLLFASFLAFSLFSVQPVHAVCPVCTVAVGAVLGLSRYLGIDDIITSLWIGGLIVSTIYWIIDWLGKRNKKGIVVNILSTVFAYALVLVPLYWGGIIGHPFNTFCGIDKILFGTIIGSFAFFFGAQLHFYLKKQNKDKVVIPFQKVVVPVGALWLISLIFYFIIY